MKYIALGVGLVLLDRITKSLAVKTPFTTLHINEDLVFSLPVPSLLLMTIVTIFAAMVVLVCIWLLYTRKNTLNIYQITSLLLIIIGASSNIYDRIVYGGVIDFIPGIYSVFNVSDIYVVVGVLLMIFTLRKKALNTKI